MNAGERAKDKAVAASLVVVESSSTEIVVESSSSTVAYAPTIEPVVALLSKPVQLPKALLMPPPPSKLADDLFDAHDFDVDIDLNVPGAGTVSVNTGGTECTSQRVGKNRRCQENGKRDVCWDQWTIFG